MDWVYLAVGVNGSLYTVSALRRTPYKRAWLALPSFLLSFFTIEAAWVHVVLQVGATAFFARRGALGRNPGRLAFVFSAGSALAAAVLVVRSINVRHEIRAAFAEAPPPVPERRRLGVRLTRNIAFARIGAKSLRLDVFEPKAPAPPGTRRPAILHVHGGGWVIGDKRDQGLLLLRHLAAQGWVGFNANYRHSPAVAFPDHLVDVKRAVAWIREHADEYGVDPGFVVVTGGSAGGHLAALTALTAGEPAYQPGFEEADTSVQACVPFYGVYDLTDRGHYPQWTVRRFFGRVVLRADPDTQPERFAEASPVERVQAGAPPFLVIHGDRDSIVPVVIAREFVAALRGVSKAPVVYLELRGVEHGFDLFTSIRGHQVVRAVDRFVDQLWAEHLAGVAPEDVPAGELGSLVDGVTADPVTS
jgi:acetyl esterase/lipase